MSRVFISHSRLDRTLTANVAKLLQNIGETAVIMEYQTEGKDVPPFEEIRKAVIGSDYVMLFKTDNAIQSDHTKSWIVFEVGVASATNKRLIVFERRGPPIHFPIPYLTDYMLFDPETVSDVLKVQEVAKGVRENLTKKKESGSAVWGLLFLFAPQLFLTLALLGALSGPIPITCSRCRSSYTFYAGILDAFQCPVCLTEINPTANLTPEQVRALQNVMRSI